MRNIHHLLLFSLTLFSSAFSTLSTVSNSTQASSCGKFILQYPFTLQTSPTSSLFSHILLCRSSVLYFRTSLGLFPVSSIDYEAKTLTVSHTCSSSLHFVSPALLAAGFPSPPQPNSLLLLNCAGPKRPLSSFHHNCTSFPVSCPALAHQKHENSISCMLIDGPEEVEIDFNSNSIDYKCSHYVRVHRSSSIVDELKLGTRISFQIPDHVPNVCDQCSKPNGNCGIGLRCICHPSQCKDKVFSGAMPTKCPSYNILLPLVTLLIVLQKLAND